MDGIKLNDGYVIPRIGLGTFRISPADAEKGVEYALRNGYCMIDTANVYMNEEAVGRGIKSSGKPREEFFLTSKIFPNSFKHFEKAVDETLERLGVEYLDLLLLHRPYGNWKKAYQDLVAAQKAGKVRSVGVSNFSLKQLQEIIQLTGVTPVLNQVECNPYCARVELQQEMAKLGIITQSWFPFGGGDSKLLSEEVLVNIAKAHNASVQQVILSYLMKRDIVVIPGSRNPAHIQSNFESQNLVLADEEMEQITKLSKGEGHNEFLGSFFYRFLPTNYYEKK